LIGVPIRNKSYYIQALIHRSFLEEKSDNNSVASELPLSNQVSNERLEFLGDSVLNLVIAEFLFKNYPAEEEGFLTKARAKMVNRNTLNIIADNIDLDEFVLLSSNVPKTVFSNSKNILSDAFEALIGAMYLDSGLDACRNFIKRSVFDPILKEGDHLVDENYKSQLLEYAQANRLNIPSYHIISEIGPHHDRTFTVEVSIGSEKLGTGTGKSKKSAEQNAAQSALKKFQKN
jgi:ribonuclease-3